MIRNNEGLIDNVAKENRGEKGALRAHRLINLVQDKVRNQMIDEMKVADDEERELRLKKRIQQELDQQEFKKQQRRAMMPMHKNPPDFVEKNHQKSTFLKGKQNTKGMTL